MQIKCPVCEQLLQVSDEKIRSHSCRCASCGTEFFLAGDLPFRYGTPLPPSAKCQRRVECPYCSQHYNLTTETLHNMLGCIKCLKIFVIPRSLRQIREDDVSRKDPENARSAINPSTGANRAGSIKVVSLSGKSAANPETLVPEALDAKGNPIQNLRQKQEKLPDIAFSGKDRSEEEKQLMQRFEGVSSLFPGPSESAVQKEMQPEFPAASVEQMKISERNFASAPTALEPFPARKTDSVSARIPPPPAPAKVNQPQEQKFPENLRIIRKEEQQEKVSRNIPAPDNPPPGDIFTEENTAFSPGENNASSSGEKGIQNRETAGNKNANKNTPSDDKEKIRRITGNILWLFCGGLTSAIITFIQGGILCITIIGIPFGLQLFKVAKLYLSPFGAQICNKNEEGTGCLATGGNILWILLGGWLTALLNLLLGAILFCTVIGIPFAFQYFKFAKLILSPFGKEVRTKAGGKELLICILAVFLLQYVIIPIVTSKIRNSINKAVMENIQNTSGAKNASSNVLDIGF